MDTTPALRPYAKTLQDKSIVYNPNNTLGNKPIGVGHSYSVLAHLPEKSSSFPWLLPLDVKRVPTDEKGHVLGFTQMEELLIKEETPFHQSLCVLVSDSLYGVLENRKRVGGHDNLVWVYRLRNNRNVFAKAPDGQTRKKYGSKMKLNVPETHLIADQEGEFALTTIHGRKRIICFKRWYGLLFRGSRYFKGYENPFDLMEFHVLDDQREPVFKRPLWLCVEGKRRHELTSPKIYESYRQRYDLEHFFRFGKNRLLMDQFQTPDLEHEENWWKLVQLAYVQLFLGRKIAKVIPRPWERYLKEFRGGNQEAGPTQVQRNFTLILDEIGTPAKEVRECHPGKGRQLGDVLNKRDVSEINFKKPKKKTTDKVQKAENKRKNELLGFQENVKYLKTLNFDNLLKIIKNVLNQTGISEQEFIEKLESVAPT